MFYKTSKPEIVKAMQKHFDQKEQLVISAVKWAAKFNGEPIFSDRSSRVSVAGIKLKDFTERDDRRLWTKPAVRLQFLSRPLAKPPRAAFKDEHAALVKVYTKGYPEPIERKELFDSISCSWGDFMFSGLEFFVVGDTAYMKTGIHLPDIDLQIVEMFGSEFKAVREVNRNA